MKKKMTVFFISVERCNWQISTGEWKERETTQWLLNENLILKILEYFWMIELAPKLLFCDSPLVLEKPDLSDCRCSYLHLAFCPES